MLVMAWWGSSYLRACLDELLAPGKSFVFVYKGQGGDVRLSARRFAVNLEQRALLASDVAVTAPEGIELVRAAHVQARMSGPRIDVEIDRVDARISRLEGGRFDLESILPPPGPDQPQQPIRLQIGAVVAQLSDRSEAPVLTRTLVMRNTTVDAIGLDVAGSTELSGSGLERVVARFQSSQDGSFVVATESGMSDLAGWVPVVRRLVPNLPPYRVASLRASGPLRVERVGTQPIRVQGAARAEVAGVDLGQGIRLSAAKAEAKFEGDFARIVASATVPGGSGDFDGVLRLGKNPQLGGRVTGRLASLAAVPAQARRLLPSGVGVEAAQAEGWLRWAGQTWSFHGAASARSVRAQGIELQQMRSDVAANERLVAVRLRGARLDGIALQGAANLDPKTGRIEGYLDTERGPVGPVLARLGVPGVSGTAELVATIAGTLAQPRVEAMASGRGSYTPEGGQGLFLGNVQARASLLGQNLHLRRLTAIGPNGTYWAGGQVDLAKGTMDVQVTGGGLDLGTLAPNVQGMAFARARATGPLTDPTVTGRVEAYGVQVEGSEVPQVAANVRATKSEVLAEDILGLIGTGRVEGDAKLVLDGMGLSGQLEARGISLIDLGVPDVFGELDASGIVLGGTVEKPTFAGLVTTPELVAYGVPVTDLRAEFGGGLEQIDLTSATAKVDGGLVTATGKYQPDTELGEVSAAFEDIPLARAPGQTPDLTLGGTATGTVSLSLQGTEVHNGILQASLRRASLNATLIGNGSLSATWEGSSLTANAMVGSIDRYIRLPEATYDLTSKAGSARAVLYNLPVEDFASIFAKQVNELDPEARRLARGTSGSVSANAQVAVDEESVTASGKATVSNLTVAGRAAGEIELVASSEGQNTRVDQLTWSDGEGLIRVTGAVGADRVLSGDVQVSNWNLNWVNVLAPEAPPVSGTLSFAGIAGGTLDDPEVRGSLDASDVRVLDPAGASIDLPVAVSLSRVLYKDERVELTGLVDARVAAGSLEGVVPLAALRPEGEGAIEPVRVVLDIPERSLEQLRAYAPWLGANAAGTFQGKVALSGVAGALELDGRLNLAARQLDIQGSQTGVRDLDAKLEFTDESASLQARGTSTVEGSFTAQAEADWPSLLADAPILDQLLDEVSVQASVQLDSFKVRQKLLNAAADSQAAVTGRIAVSGAASRPAISGELTAHQVDVSVPTEFPPSVAGGPPPVNPSFEGLRLTVAPGSRVSMAAGDVRLGGSGTLNGTLESPDLRLPLEVQAGEFRLPNARVRLEPAGSIDVRYVAFSQTQSDMRVDLDLQGRTVLAARRGDQYESYEIELNIRGNVLQEGGLRIEARSEPPDLSEDQILAILGQRDLIEALARGATGGGAGEELRSALYSVGLPTLTQGFTQEIAGALQLDFVNVDYNAFDGTIIAAGKTLAPGLLLYGRRQLSQPTSGPLKYELRLSYRPRLRNPLLSRFRFSIGIDQDRPWKVAIDWSQRL